MPKLTSQKYLLPYVFSNCISCLKHSLAYFGVCTQIWNLLNIVVTETWNDLKPPTTIYNHLQPPWKHLQPLANNLKPSKTRYKCHEMSEIRRDSNMSRTWNTRIEQNIHFPLKSYSPWSLVSSTIGLSHEMKCEIMLSILKDLKNFTKWTIKSQKIIK